MIKGLLVLLISIIITSGFEQNNWQHGKLNVSANGHYLSYEDGTPFFWLGDTGWELFHRLKLQEIATYLDNRKQKGFNVIQAAILAEFDGLRKPNQYGEVPLENLDPTTPNEKYFQFVDTVVKLASSKGLYMGLLPTWGDKVTQLWGEGPVVFNPENEYIYGFWIGKRYKDYKNIIWILGGDRPPMKDSSDWRPIWRNMAKGILEGTNKKALITYHPVNPWPTWNPENGYYRDYDVRKQTYRSVFAGACGVTYVYHSVWQFWSAREEKINYADRYWTEAINRPGAFQVGYLKMLIESRPQLNRIPDQSLIVKGQGEKGEHICAFRDSAGSYEMIYIPVGQAITINTSFINSEKLNAWWFNPRTAESIRIGIIANKSIMDFTTPTIGFENDWVLIIDNAENNYRILDLKR